jgi:hypothetical protein
MKKLSWTSWLLEEISLDGTISNILPRQTVIQKFCLNGLYPFIVSKGYVWRIEKDVLIAKVLRLMYFAYRKKRIFVEDYNYDWNPEHKQIYWSAVDTDAWDTLWTTWGMMEDFDEQTGFAYRLRFSLPNYVWNWLDLEKSPRAIKLEKDLYDPDTQDVYSELRGQKAKEDPYLQDLMVGTTIYDKHRL